MDAAALLEATPVTIPYGSGNLTLLTGLISTPNVRATFDIVWSCVFTIGLSSWSILCLNTPARHETTAIHLRRKFLWTAFVIIGPEAVLQLALAQYFEALRNTRAFHAAGFSSWSLTHSFYANMGGFHLQSPDEGEFPVTALQIKYLVEHKYITMPELTKRQISDRNKADIFVRVLTLGQISWFMVSTIARAQQGLAITTLELTTLAFVFIAGFIFFFWFCKPMDVETFDMITTTTDMAAIRKSASQTTNWVSSPLEFVDRQQQWPWNLYWHYSLTLARRLTHSRPAASTVPKGKLVQRFADDIWPIPDTQGVLFSFIAHFGYAGILVAGWNLEMPSFTELILWRASVGFQICMLAFLWCVFPWFIHPTLVDWAHRPERAARRWWLSDQAEKVVSVETRHKIGRVPGLSETRRRAHQARVLINDDPAWTASLRMLLAYLVIWSLYGVARMYTVAADIATLRAMPVSAYQTVNWSLYIPHI